MRLLLLLLSALAAPLSACLWDYDTLAQESAGMPDIKAVIVGGFARNPDLYYEMRLERLTKLLADNPDDLDAYDGAAVACDRLGRGDEAIEWMAKKLAAMDRSGYVETAQPNHRYRYLANLGTFYAHRWFRGGANREKLEDLLKARELVARAIEENPDAHFGREKYQLMFIDWLLAGPRYTEDEKEAKALGQDTGWVPNVLGIGKDGHIRIATGDNDNLKELGIEDAVEGIAGLITLGAAWESVDAFYALTLALQADGKSAFSYFARLRLEELIHSGAKTVVAGLQGDSPQLEPERFQNMPSPVKDKSGTKAEFTQLRQQADAWHNTRTSYMLERLNAGEHPDTHPDFWSGFEGDPYRMQVPSGVLYEAGGFWRAIWISDASRAIAIFIGGVTLLVAYFFYARRRDRKRGHIHGAAKAPYP